MNLKAKIHVEKQKAAAQETLNARTTFLKEEGLEDKRIQRDTTVRQLKAQIAKANTRLARIAAKEKLNQERAQAKIDKPAKKKAAKEARKAKAGKAEPEKKEKKAKKQKQAEPGGKAKEKKG